MINILTAKQMRKSDLNAINNNEEISRALMYKAALGVYNSVIWSGKIGIVCGKGNNGGDGYALALILKQNGIKSKIIQLLGNPKEDTSAYFYFEECKSKGIEITEKTDFSDYDILVDCVFGTGFTGNVDSCLEAIFNAYNRSGAYKVSVDINSGLNSNSGLGNAVMCSDLTVSIGSYKLGHFLNKARDVIKKHINIDIGIEPCEVNTYLFEESDARLSLPSRKSYSYKGTYGTVSIIGGCIEYTGALKLSSISMSAVRAGCGISRVAAPKGIAQIIAPYLLDSTLYRLSDSDGAIKYEANEIDYLIKSSNVILYGMGTSENADAVEIVKHILREFSGTLILDAGGLRALSKISLDEIRNRACSLVLTPHIGEMRALYPEYAEPLDALAYAKSVGAIVLLKGNTTIVTDGSTSYLVASGCPSMAKGGSGDVLSGVVAGMCASMGSDTTLLYTVASAAYINGVAGEIAQSELCDISACAHDTALCVGKAITKIKGTK